MGLRARPSVQIFGGLRWAEQPMVALNGCNFLVENDFFFFLRKNTR